MRKKTKEEFIQDAIKIHGNKYDYSKVEYINARTKVQIYCNKCKEYFWQRPNDHIRNDKFNGCPICARNNRSYKLRLSLDNFIQKAQKIHNKNEYDYSKVEYINNRTKVKIYCNRCKKYFLQRPHDHLQGQGCLQCGFEKLKKLRTDNTEIFIQKAQKIHNKNEYDYSKVEYINNRTKVQIFCNKCKKYFWQKPNDHLNGKGCQRCNISNGEKEINNMLKEYNINFESQKRFKDCKDKKPLPFDFYLPDYNVCIEFQGKQHYIPDMFILYNKSKTIGLENFKILQHHDQIKRDYCKKNNIILIEIKYNDNIEEKLNNYLKGVIHND